VVLEPGTAIDHPTSRQMNGSSFLLWLERFIGKTGTVWQQPSSLSGNQLHEAGSRAVLLGEPEKSPASRKQGERKV